MSKRQVIFTIDVDMTNYVDQQNVFYDELKFFTPVFFKAFNADQDIRATWFLRIDSQVEKVFGMADYVFKQDSEIIAKLIDVGNEIGWHHHPYKNVGDKWLQEIDETIVTSEIEKYGKIARENGLNICRMGWGFQTNNTLKALDRLNFVVDSSAIPRPKYEWAISFMDWEDATTTPYYPSISDYKNTGHNNLTILEVPITTSLLKAKYDTEEVIRYLNPAYHHHKFVEAFNAIQNKELICMIMHPYEVMPNKNKHDLLSFSMEDLEKNLQFLKEQNYDFVSFDNIRTQFSK